MGKISQNKTQEQSVGLTDGKGPLALSLYDILNLMSAPAPPVRGDENLTRVVSVESCGQTLDWGEQTQGNEEKDTVRIDTSLEGFCYKGEQMNEQELAGPLGGSEFCLFYFVVQIGDNAACLYADNISLEEMRQVRERDEREIGDKRRKEQKPWEGEKEWNPVQLGKGGVRCAQGQEAGDHF